MGHVTGMSQPLAGVGLPRAARVVAQALAVLGLAMAAGCADSGKPAACAELQSDLDDLEARFDAPEAGQSWDGVQEVAEATGERDRLRAELAQAGCPTET
jgi:hypothetical protein